MEQFSLRACLFVFIIIKLSNAAFYIQYQKPSDCIRFTSGGSESYYFDVTQLKCVPCSQSNIAQATSSDGLNCVCRENYHIDSITNGILTCAACPAGQVSSVDGWECVRCATNMSSTSVTSSSHICPQCSSDKRLITVERWLDGSWGSPAYTRSCQQCADETFPDADQTKCVRCNQILSVSNRSTCDCPSGQLAGGICFKSPNDIVAATQQLFRVTFSESVSFDSQYFKDNTQAAAAMCQPGYSNTTACQLLANLCVLIIYNEGSDGAPTACTLYLKSGSATGNRIAVSWPSNLPWLYYLEKASSVLTDITIPTKYQFPDMQLALQVSVFDISGSFLGFRDVTGGLLQLCRNSDTFMDAAYLFGTTYEHTCDIAVRDFWDTNIYPLEFYDIWLKYEQNSVNQLFAVPILINNFVNSNGKTVNQENSPDNWQLVRRIFLVDNISGRQAVSGSGGSLSSLHAVRFAESVIIHIELQPGQSDGLIYPPYVEIKYNIATLDDFAANKNVSVAFKVVYSMSLGKFERDLSIAVGILLAFALVYACIQTWAWSHRAGKIAIDFVTLLKFILFACGSMANAFFVTILGSSIWWLIFFKKQKSVYLLVDDGTTGQFLGFLIAAFVLKLLHIFHLIFCQSYIDIFLIDWERSAGKIVASSGDSAKSGTRDVPVSIWRTYFVANEWNEIQTIRKISPTFQYFATVFFLHVIGFGNLATMDPKNEFQMKMGDDTYYAPMSNVLRFALIGIVYLLVALGQWLFVTFIYERFFEHKVQQFVDLCSLSNISVFILENEMFGYYIHGRSVHGRADVGLREMHENFVREEKDLVGQRGLEPNSDQQTFQIAVPRRLRIEYDRIIKPVIAEQAGGAAQVTARRRANVDANNARTLDPPTECSLFAYLKLNKFLQSFIDHCDHDVDYVVKPTNIFESLIGAEFKEPTDKGFFYTDGGSAFASVLLYGNELTLLIFEVLFFEIIDLGTHSYFLDAAILYVLMEIILKSIRDGLGRNNLAKKTLVDKRFLI